MPSARPSIAQTIEPRAVVPQDLAPRLVRDAVDLKKRVERLRKGRIPVGPVRRDHDIVIAQGLNGINHQFLVRVHGQKALPAEVIAGRMLQSIASLVAKFFPTFVEAIQPGGSPAAEPLEKSRS